MKTTSDTNFQYRGVELKRGKWVAFTSKRGERSPIKNPDGSGYYFESAESAAIAVDAMIVQKRGIFDAYRHLNIVTPEYERLYREACEKKAHIEKLLADAADTEFRAIQIPSALDGEVLKRHLSGETATKIGFDLNFHPANVEARIESLVEKMRGRLGVTNSPEITDASLKAQARAILASGENTVRGLADNWGLPRKIILKMLE